MLTISGSNDLSNTPCLPVATHSQVCSLCRTQLMHESASGSRVNSMQNLVRYFWNTTLGKGGLVFRGGRVYYLKCLCVEGKSWEIHLKIWIKKYRKIIWKRQGAMKTATLPWEGRTEGKGKGRNGASSVPPSSGLMRMIRLPPRPARKGVDHSCTGDLLRGIGNLETFLRYSK